MRQVTRGQEHRRVRGRTALVASVLVVAAACGGGDDEAEPAPAEAPEDVDDSRTDSEIGEVDDGDVEDVATIGPFEIEGDTAEMFGEIDSNTPDDVQALIDDYPDVATIVLVDVPGSGDDQANLEASRLVRSAGLATHVPADGEIASGGVDFYLAGASRTYDDGARFGVHSWATDDGIEGGELPEDDPEHDLYLDYYDEMGVDEEFYWFTLEAAPAADIHWMTSGELETYGFATS